MTNLLPLSLFWRALTNSVVLVMDQSTENINAGSFRGQITHSMYVSFCLMFELFLRLKYAGLRKPNQEQNTENIKVAWRIWICFYHNVTTLRCVICKACNACLRCRLCKMRLYRAEDKPICQNKMLIFYISLNHRYVQTAIYHLNIPMKCSISRSQGERRGCYLAF